jgi:hypothetical protein
VPRPWNAHCIAFDPSEDVRPEQDPAPEAYVVQVRQVVLDELRTAERELAQSQEATPDPARAIEPSVLREAITVLARLVAHPSPAANFVTNGTVVDWDGPPPRPGRGETRS